MTSFVAWTILLLVYRTGALSVAANDRVPEESLDRDDTSGSSDNLEGSARIRTRNNSPALNHFLEDVLSAQDELKWIDRAVHRSGNPRNIESTLLRRQSRDQKPRKKYEEPRRVYLEEESKPKREIDDEHSSDSASSLASLKRTIIELSDSLNPRESEKRRIRAPNEKTSVDGKRKLLSSRNIRSAMDIAMEYYDYEDDGESPDAMMNRPMEREAKQETTSPLIAAAKTEITKKDENTEEEKKEEEFRKQLKNKVPKEEFISDLPDSSPENDKKPPQSSNSLYNSLLLKRMPAAQDSEFSDFYSQCEVGSSGDSKNFENSILAEMKNSNVDPKNDDAREIDEPKFSKERTYLVISPSIEKRTKKRSVNSIVDDYDENVASSRLKSNAEKSARNYAALKITDDMFKGGIEQSNSLVEDKPIVVKSTNFSSVSLSSPDISPVSLRSLRFKTTSPEWKIIEVVGKEKFEPRHSLQSERGFGRHLTQIVHEGSFRNSSSSSVSTSLTTDSHSHETTLIPQSTNPSEGIIANASTRKYPEIVNENSTIDANFTISSVEKKLFSRDIKIFNNTRPRRHAESFDRKNLPKRRKHRSRRHHKNRKNWTERKRQSVDGDAQRRKLTVLLAADNIEDESQIDLAVHGELAGKIVERIFEQVQRNEGLKVAFGPGLYRKHKPQESMALDKMYRQGLDEHEVKETEAMMRRVMELLGRLVLDEVRRKTCASLAPDMRDFLQWSLGLEELADPLSDQIPPLPLIPGHGQQQAPEKSPYKFLFPNSTRDSSSGTGLVSELERKVNLLKSLISEYHALTEREKTKVQTVHDYLVRQLALLVKYIESKEAANNVQGSQNILSAGARLVPQQILQYQASVPNSNNTRASKNLTGPLDMRDSKNRQHPFSMFNDRPMDLFYSNDNSRGATKQSGLWTKRSKRTSELLDSSQRIRREEKNDPSNRETDESIEYRKLLQQIATLRRKKRAYSWGYEKPKIYVEPEKTNITIYHFTPTITERSGMIFSSGVSDALLSSSLLPVREKNRLNDEILLLNKREAWKKENQRLLEEVAFGRDTRDDLISMKIPNFSKLNAEAREKRAFQPEISSEKTMKLENNTIEGFFNKSMIGEIEESINVFPVETTNMKITSSPSKTTL